MYKDMIRETIQELDKLQLAFREEEKQFIIFYGYKTGDMERVRKLIQEIKEAQEQGTKDEIFRKYCKIMGLSQGIEHFAENMLVNIERYRLSQEKAIATLVDILELHGVKITMDEVRDTELMELRKKIHKKIKKAGGR